MSTWANRAAKKQKRNLADKLSDGTRISGFVTAEENPPPRECSHCRHNLNGHCQHPIVNNDDELEDRMTDQGVKVESTDCCNFYQALDNGRPESNPRA